MSATRRRSTRGGRRRSTRDFWGTDTVDNDWVRTARAKGLSEKQVIRRHVLRNGLIPPVNIWGLDFSHAFGGFVLYVEVIFGLPGVGALTACGNVQSGNYWRALVSSRLDADIAVVTREKDPTRVLVRGPAEDGGPYEPDRVPAGLTRRVAVPDWEIWTACRR